MKIDISIQNNKELRTEIKNMIEGQVKSVLREDIKTLVKEGFISSGGKILFNKDEIQKLIKEIIREEVRRILSNQSNNRLSTDWVTTYAKAVIDERVSQVFAKFSGNK